MQKVLLAGPTATQNSTFLTYCSGPWFFVVGLVWSRPCAQSACFIIIIITQFISNTKNNNVAVPDASKNVVNAKLKSWVTRYVLGVCLKMFRAGAYA